MARDLGSLSWNKPGEGSEKRRLWGSSNKGQCGKRSRRRAFLPCGQRGSPQRDEPGTPALFILVTSMPGQERWRTEEVELGRRLLLGALPAREAQSSSSGGSSDPGGRGEPAWRAAMMGSHPLEEDGAGSQYQLLGSRTMLTAVRWL